MAHRYSKEVKRFGLEKKINCYNRIAGGGTRVYAQTLKELGFYLGRRLNGVLDELHIS